MLPVYVKRPSAAKLMRPATHFQLNYHILQCVGCIQVPIAPSLGREIMGSSGSTQRLLQHQRLWYVTPEAVTDWNNRFWNFICGWPGHNNDGRIFRCSDLATRSATFFARLSDRKVIIGSIPEGEVVKAAVPNTFSETLHKQTRNGQSPPTLHNWLLDVTELNDIETQARVRAYTA
ncbi:hypothetical protein BDK51DRAFT_39440 [Blyttiomyces helicus]|uniref:Uncharacterized protein n=1 Tax=Blyttiomyces helicus TaxID=388810 RepID=A0A4P9W6C9_9FUNG|nr:hypothetical protein BDK51DRAFT_39440 [Blyttiomyces helicus]|eukprot:RKO86915.1 hypothetical protein BDK51DRAFT_39440 [Blyttiomyces helicus]